MSLPNHETPRASLPLASSAAAIATAGDFTITPAAGRSAATVAVTGRLD